MQIVFINENTYNINQEIEESWRITLWQLSLPLDLIFIQNLAQRSVIKQNNGWGRI